MVSAEIEHKVMLLNGIESDVEFITFLDVLSSRLNIQSISPVAGSLLHSCSASYHAEPGLIYEYYQNYSI
jgi:hypothetical protein